MTPLSSAKTYDLIVLGAGVVGVATAYWAERAGLDVGLVDRRGGPARETSFANGAQLSVSHATPWASPEALGQIARWLLQADAPLAVTPGAALRDGAWAAAFLRQASPARARANLIAGVRLATYSRAQMNAIDAAEAIDYGRRTTGIIHFYRKPKAYAAGLRMAALMTAHGGRRAALSLEDLLAREPAFAPLAPHLAGATLAPEDGVGDPHAFSTALVGRLAARGVALSFDTEILAVEDEGDAVTIAVIAQGQPLILRARHAALCLGVATPDIARRGRRPPIAPVKGYSATIPITNIDKAPRTALIDDENKLVYATLGPHLRVAGMAELRGRDRRLDPRRVRVLLEHIRATFPGAGDLDRARLWTGLRPMTPSGLPMIGSTEPHGRVWINAGHSALGWTMAAGAGRLLIDQITGRAPEIEWPG